MIDRQGTGRDADGSASAGLSDPIWRRNTARRIVVEDLSEPWQAGRHRFDMAK
jgi:hypothetical protein